MFNLYHYIIYLCVCQLILSYLLSYIHIFLSITQAIVWLWQRWFIYLFIYFFFGGGGSNHSTTQQSEQSAYMMTSSNGNVADPLCGKFIGHWWIPLTKASDAQLWCFLWSAPWINGWVNNREAGDLIRHRAHYDVIVMISRMYYISVLYYVRSYQSTLTPRWLEPLYFALEFDTGN